MEKKENGRDLKVKQERNTPFIAAELVEQVVAYLETKRSELAPSAKSRLERRLRWSIPGGILR